MISRQISCGLLLSPGFVEYADILMLVVPWLLMLLLLLLLLLLPLPLLQIVDAQLSFVHCLLWEAGFELAAGADDNFGIRLEVLCDDPDPFAWVPGGDAVFVGAWSSGDSEVVVSLSGIPLVLAESFFGSYLVFFFLFLFISPAVAGSDDGTTSSSISFWIFGFLPFRDNFFEVFTS